MGYVSCQPSLARILLAYGKFDRLEYGGIWLVTIVMAAYGMTAGLIAGVISALSTYAVQSVNYQNPIRGYMSAFTLRSSNWNRPAEAKAILDDRRIGRKRILIFQLQGHVSRKWRWRPKGL